MKRVCVEPNSIEGVLGLAITYLAGPMQFAKDNGVEWRREIIRQCHHNRINLRFLDPTNKIEGMNAEDEIQAVKDYRLAEDYESLTKVVKRFRSTDLRCVDYADFIIAHIDTNVHMCGTYNEIFLAESQQKPILAIVNGGPAKAPDWLFGVIDYREMFSSIEGVVDHLNKINKGEIKLDDRWMLIRKSILSISSPEEAEVQQLQTKEI